MEKTREAVKGSAKNNAESQVNINFGRLLQVVMSRWYWILASFVVFMLFGFFYINATQPKYQSEALLKYNSNDKQQKLTNPLTTLLKENNNADYNAEIYSMRSYTVISHALDSLHMHFSFSADKGLRRINIYPQTPFSARVLNYDIDTFGSGEFTIKKAQQGYDIVYKIPDWVNAYTKEFKNVHEGDSIAVPGLSFILSSDIKGGNDEEISFQYIDYWYVKMLINSLSIAEAEREMPILKASFTSNNSLFTKDFLRSAINSYMSYDVERKKMSSEQTMVFINEQERTFETLLHQSSNKLEGFKRNYDDVVDIQASTKQYVTSLSELRTRRYAMEIQAKNIDMVANDLKNNRDVVANVVSDGTPDALLTGMVTQLNGLKYQRKQQVINFSPQAQVIKNLDEEIESLKSKIIANIAITLQRNKQEIQGIDQQLAEVNARMGRIPTAERDLVYLTSDVDVNKNIYNALLNKKLETSIEKAGVMPSFSIIEYPQVSIYTFPKTTLLYIVFALAGIICGVLLVFIRRTLNNKFSDLSMLKKQSDIPLLGVVNHYAGQDKYRVLHTHNEASLFSESITAVRTHIAYTDGRNEHKVIVITSDTPGAGKSFISVNLAVALTKINKKVIVVATDLRRSSLHQYFNDRNEHGLSNFLQEENETAEKIICQSAIPGLSYIPSGPVPSNPAELLFLDKFNNLVTGLKEEYDYVILDTSPVGLVTDAIPMIRRADMTIFILRWLHSNVNAVSIPALLAAEYALGNIHIVVNDFVPDDFYGSLEAATDSGSISKYYSSYGLYNNEEIKRNILGRLFKRK